MTLRELHLQIGRMLMADSTLSKKEVWVRGHQKACPLRAFNVYEDLVVLSSSRDSEEGELQPMSGTAAQALSGGGRDWNGMVEGLLARPVTEGE